MDRRVTESEILELENKLLHPTAEPISLPLGFLESITSDFSKEQEIGSGGYGVVYKGTLRCGSVIAVKKFRDGHLVDGDQFQNEASFLMGIKHQNLVQLLGFCAESRGAMMMKQPNGKCIVVEQLTRMLCFEYMCNQGLDKHLSDESSGLEWNMRYKIIKGICNGLNFLHERKIVHLDLKPQNILMDATMMPKIADFGLSRLLGEQESYTITVTSNRAGTMGYMAPEYINRGIISMKADIFSLGVIIIEILKGCRDDYPDYCQSTEKDFQHFTEKVLNNWRDRFERAPKYTALELQAQLVKQCMDIALDCVHPDKEKRPNVSNIIEILNAAEGSCYDQNGKDLLINHQMGSQEDLWTSDVLREDGLVALNKIPLKDHAQVSITKGMMKSTVAQNQQQCEPILGGYQGARYASVWLAQNALSSLESNLLKDWAATNNVAPNVNSLNLELISVTGILESTLGKVIHNSTLERSLMMLQDLIYDAEDVVDEMEYFRIQDILRTHNLDLNVLPSVHDETLEMMFDRVHACSRMKHIVEQMQEVQRSISGIMTHLGSNWSTFPNIAKSRPTSTSESIEPKLYGREHMMKRIIDDITKGKHSGEVLTVIPIVGPGGIGKTALAQHIYHSREVQEHFDVRVWTCVSLNFNVNKLTEEIQRCIPKVDHESSNGNASELIGKRVENKRFLLVLDDIWDCSDDDEWKRLLVPFKKSQELGNIIIVTTRFPAQAHIMVWKNYHSIYLQGLDSEPFEELFLEIIFGDDDQARKDHNCLLGIGTMIAGRLKGSPLAAKTVGRLLKDQLNLDHWTRVLESKEWEHSNGKNDIMPALKLSFDYLPSQLQQCFSYFALFPQDYKFERQELINFWIGQEVLYSSDGGNKRVEDIGLSCLTKLVNYGFLLENKGGEDERTCYIIHDLLHELAQKVSSLECLSIDSSQFQMSSLQVLPSIRHLSITIDDTSAKDRVTVKNCVEDFNTLGTKLSVEKLRTLMIFGKHHGCFVKAFGDLFREAKALRLVFLSGASYDMKDLLHNFYCLIHLRYLRIESSWAFRISRFYHMKVLDAKHCDVIDDLGQRDFSNLLKLRYLLVKDDAMHSRIIDVGKLKSLQELRRFVVKQYVQGFELRQIGHLKELSGSLCIKCLENVKAPDEADEAKLMLKTHLHELMLHWSERFNPSRNLQVEKHVLERLKPSPNLQKLSITGHTGDTFPSWLGMNPTLSSLKSLCLCAVNWKTFPPIGDLRLVNVPQVEMSINIPQKRFGNLRRLKLVHLSGLKTWTVHAPCELFPYLEVLIIKHCFQLVELSFLHSAGCCQQGNEVNVNLFPRLKRLKIKNCRQLASIPPIPWSEAQCSIDIQGTSSPLHLFYEINYKHSLSIFGKKDNNDSTFWKVLAFHKLTGLKKLHMQNCQFPALSNFKMLSSLRELILVQFSNAFPFVEANYNVQYLLPLESLAIYHWNASGIELTQLLTYFPKLSDLKVGFCEKPVTGLGVNVRGQRATETPASEAERGMLLLPPQLQMLDIQMIPRLTLQCNPHDDSNEDYWKSGGGRGGGLQALTSLRRLKIWRCPNLLSNYSSSSFSSSIPFPNSLEHLYISGAEGMDTMIPVSNLTSLTSLDIHNCGDLRGEGLLPLLAQGHLTDLSIMETPNFIVDFDSSNVHEQDIPSCYSKLQKLSIDDVARFTAVAIRCRMIFSSLTTLKICEDNKVECFTEEQEALLFVNSLEDVEFSSCHNLKSLPKQLHGLHNLKRLAMMSCREIDKIPNDVLPCFLEEFVIYNCPKIQSLPKDCLPDSLQKLKIIFCPAIRLLPEVADLPTSLRELDVCCSESMELTNQCRKFINIIPIVKVDKSKWEL